MILENGYLLLHVPSFDNDLINVNQWITVLNSL